MANPAIHASPSCSQGVRLVNLEALPQETLIEKDLAKHPTWESLADEHMGLPIAIWWYLLIQGIYQ